MEDNRRCSCFYFGKDVENSCYLWGKVFIYKPEVTEDNEDLIVKTMNHTALSIYRLADFRFRYVGEFTVTVRNSNFEPTNGALHIIDVLAVKDAMRLMITL